MLTNNAERLLGHEEAQNLVDMLSKQSPRLVEGLIPDLISLGVVVKVMQNLLNEASQSATFAPSSRPCLNMHLRVKIPTS